jgi:hypothetical protein
VPSFEFYVGIDYSGARTPTDGLPGLRVYAARRGERPVAVRPVTPAGARSRRHWTRRGVAGWLAARLQEGPRALVGIDHGFSFPRAYFERHGLPHDWSAFLEDFAAHWPTDGDRTTVDDVRRGLVGRGALRDGDARWRRLCELRTGGTKSVFHFDVQGSVAKSTHAGLPWLLRLRLQAGARVHFWPYDGWQPATGRSVVAEVFPSLWRRRFPRGGRTSDQHDAFVVAAWLQQVDAKGELARYWRPALAEPERDLAGFEGWILGAP